MYEFEYILEKKIIFFVQKLIKSIKKFDKDNTFFYCFQYQHCIFYMTLPYIL